MILSWRRVQLSVGLKGSTSGNAVEKLVFVRCAAAILGGEFVGRSGRAFPPEPPRYIVGSTARNAVLRKDIAEIEGQGLSWIDRAGEPRACRNGDNR
jgi:hypothetical protein